VRERGSTTNTLQLDPQGELPILALPPVPVIIEGMRKKSVSGSGSVASNAQRVLSLLARIEHPSDETAEVRERLGAIGQTQRRKCVLLCRFALASRELRRGERVRKSAAKVLVASLPTSLDAISKLLAIRTGRYAYEVHCSLFVFLSDLDELGLVPSERTRVVEVMIEYLESATTGIAHAAWMAADALGRVCDRNMIGALVNLSERGRYAAARSASIKVLQDCVTRGNVRDHLHITRTIRRIAHHDRSRRVRASARIALRRLSRQRHDSHHAAAI